MSPWDRNIQNAVDDRGVTYAAFRSALKPKWGRLWVELVALWLMILGVCVAVAVYTDGQFWRNVAVTLVGGCLTGFLIASLQLFVHEAVHYNLHPNKRINDFLSNALVSCMTGVDVRHYRMTHWDHHRYLGSDQDSEISYVDALRWKFFAESLLGIKIFRALFRHEARQKESTGREARPSGGSLLMLTGIAFNLTLFACLYLVGEYWVIVSWSLAVVVFYPFFNTLRQLLEHRAGSADAIQAGRESAPADHSGIATLRMFGNGLFARVFGGAGFNVHLLHHWDPQVSYTNFREMEAYLLRTEFGPVIEARRTSYWSTFIKLFRPTWS